MIGNNFNGNNSFGGNDSGLSLDNGGGLNLTLNGGFQQQPSYGQQSVLQSTYDFGIAQPQNDQQGAITIEIRKVYLGLTRPQADQYRRTYDVSVDGRTLDKLQDNVLRYGVEEALNPVSMSHMLSQGESLNFIHHSGTTDGAVGIDNGWETDRYRFTMVVDVYRNGAFKSTEFVSGYTDYDGVENPGLISTVTVDPNMVFTINHVTEANLRQMDHQGNPVPMISRTNGVVRNPGFQGLGSGNEIYLTRPSDVMKAVDKVAMYKGMGRAGQLGDTGGTQSYQDLDSMLTQAPRMTADTNLLIPTFTSRTVKGLVSASLNEFDPMRMDGAGAGQVAALNTNDSSYTASNFVTIMNRRLGNYVTVTGSFTFGDLLALDPTIDDRTDVFGRAYETGKLAIPNGRNVDSIGGAGREAVHATAIAHATLALMSIAGVATLAYNANNWSGGNTVITLQACDGIDIDGQLANRLENFKARLAAECLSIVGGEQATYNVDVFADAFNDVFIKIEWEGVRGEYVFPSFASAGMAPTVTQDLGRLIGIAEAIGQVVDACKQIVAPGNNPMTDWSQTAVQGNGEARYGGLAGEF